MSDPASTSPLPVPRPAERAIRDKALALGFHAVGVARADRPLERDFERYEAYLEQGLLGTMRWLGENREARRRLDTSDILPGARSVICVAARYGREGEVPAGSVAAGIARYARGRDYHNGLRKKLKQLAAFVRSLGAGVAARPMMDTAPVLERAWAARSGLGFVGKNGLVIVPGQGSLVLLGEVVTTLELAPDEPIAERCGSCTRCLDACPTQAFLGPFVLDPRRCVAYLTIEHRGPVPEPLRAPIGEHLFGCDVCQDVCPFNRARPAPAAQTERFRPLDRWSSLRPADLLALVESDWDELGEGSPVRRATLAGLIRNAITAVANGGEREHRAALVRLAEHHDDEGVREHAAWALRVLGGD